MKQIFLLFCLGLGIAGCGAEGFYTKVRSDEPEFMPRLYHINYDDGYLLALHAVELQPKWQIEYFDKNTGLIEARTPKKDKVTIRVNALDRAAVKIFAYCDTKGFSFFAEDRLKKNLRSYFEKLDAHLKGFDEEVLQ